MNVRDISFSIWLGTMMIVAADPPDISRIVIPDVPAPTQEPIPLNGEYTNASTMTQERREAVAVKIAEAFSLADSVLIASLEPNNPFLMEIYRPKMLARLRKDLLGGAAYYGSVTLDPKVVPKFLEAVVSSINNSGTPRLGFCWSPRHAIVIRKAKEPEIIVEICYECGGMRLKDGDETLTFYPPRGIRNDMDSLFDAHKIPKSTPIDKPAEQDGARQPATAPKLKPEGRNNP